MDTSKNQYVVYTCISGNYDNLIQPNILDNSFDYVCFVKKGEVISDSIGIWKIREALYDTEDNTLFARFVKHNPHYLLPEYQYSLWIDGNIVIQTDDVYRIIKRKAYDGIILSSMCHWKRDCVYDEAVACVKENKGNYWGIIRMLLFLRRNKFPKHFGLYETNVLFRQHNLPIMINFDKMWWYFISEYVTRDQLSVSYCCKVNNIPLDYLLPKEFCARNHPYFQCLDHRSYYTETLPHNYIAALFYRLKRFLKNRFAALIIG